MSGPYDPNGQDGQRPYQPVEAPQPASDTEGNAIDRQALEQALKETLAAASSGEEIDPAEMEAIRRVASGHKTPEITLDIAADLIQSVLTTHFRSLQASESFWQTISRDIARDLWDDPLAEARLNTLWQRLRKEAP